MQSRPRSSALASLLVLSAGVLTLSSCKSNGRPDGTWDLTQRIISSSCPAEHAVDEESTETYVIRTREQTLTLHAEDVDYAGALRGSSARLEGPVGGPTGDFSAAINLVFDGDAVSGDARVRTKECEFEGEVSGVRTATAAPLVERTKPKPEPAILPELPTAILEELSPDAYLASWHALETVDGTPCGEDRYERRALLTFVETSTGLFVSASAPSTGFGGVRYGDVAVTRRGNTLAWTATFASGNDQVRAEVLAHVTDDARLVAKIRWTYTYEGEPERTCSGPSVLIATRNAENPIQSKP